MKILFVSHCYPWPLDNGTVQRVFHLVEGLARRHEVTLVTLRRGTADPAIRTPLHDVCAQVIEVDDSSCPVRQTGRFEYWAPLMDRVRSLITSPLPSSVQAWRSPDLLAVLRRLNATENFDAVWVERIRLAEVVRRAGFRHFVLDLDGLESAYLAAMLKRSPWYLSKPVHYLEWLKLHVYERLAVWRFDHLVVCKEADRAWFGNKRNRVSVVPNGTERQPITNNLGERHDEMLFVGTMSYEPNSDAVRFFASKVLPLIRETEPGAHLSIVGKEPGAEVQALGDGTSCTVHGRVADLDPYYGRAGVVVAPMQMGSGTLLKVLEALGRGKAVVATSLAIDGLDLRPGVDVLVADTAAELAAACLRLFHDPGLRLQLGASARARVLERYEWTAIVGAAEATLRPDPAHREGVR